MVFGRVYMMDGYFNTWSLYAYMSVLKTFFFLEHNYEILWDKDNSKFRCNSKLKLLDISTPLNFGFYQ